MSSNLTPAQTAHAETIVQVVKARGLPVRAAHIALETARAESNLYNDANVYNAESLRLPHDGVGSNFGSVGIFQQQVGGAPHSTANWGTTEELMNPAVATEKFLDALVALSNGWMGAGHTNWGDAQAVQRSFDSTGSQYEYWDAWAIALGNALWQGTQPAPPSHQVRTYTVVEGDNLSKIARQFYGNAELWPRIYAANHQRIGADPNLITPGMVLVIP